MNVAAIGECTADRYLDRGVECVGGISLNFAVHARRAGAESALLLSCTGDDAAADRTRRALREEGVDATHLRRVPGATATQRIQLASGGERVFPMGGYDAGVLASYHLGPDDLAKIAQCDVVFAPFFRQVEHLFWPALRAARADALRVVDLLDGEDLGPSHSRLGQVLDVADVAFLSGELPLVDALLPHVRARRTLILVVTHGAQGSTALADGVRTFHPAVAVPHEERVDSTGCGDAYQAAFSVARWRGRSVSEAMQCGAERAALVLQHLGAIGRCT